MNNLKKFFKNKRIFITGHTGFKGTWLTTCLTNFGVGLQDDLLTHKAVLEISTKAKKNFYTLMKTIFKEII